MKATDMKGSWRIYLIYFGILLLALGVIVRAATVQFVEGKDLMSRVLETTLRYNDIPAIRGNIYATDGSLLATSIPIYEIRMDLNTEALTDEIFNENIDSLAICLSNLFEDKSSIVYRQELIEARANGARFHLIKKRVKYPVLKAMQKFPIFRKGRYKGGFIYFQQNIREKPFRLLAARTIGYDKSNVGRVGLEGAYSKELSGVSGKRLMQKLSGGVWMPLNDENEIEPQDGYDLYTTIDINIQDVAEQSLLQQLQKHDASHGCVVLMEVATGGVKAIANLTRNKEGNYYEGYNYAVGESTEPGSTFKLASLIAAIEDGLALPSDSVDTERGVVKFYDRKLKDSHEGGYGKITLGKAFEVSSNIGVAKVITSSYENNPQAFIDRLKSMHLHEKLGVEIVGEKKPFIKNTSDSLWSGISLAWMSHGYELRQTPLQTLAFYNAIANNGKMVRPMFIRALQDKRDVIKKVEPFVIDKAICSQNTVDKAKKMLEGVVERGTATNLRNSSFKIAGKTGTAKIWNKESGYKTVSYQASFVGYFPADSPKYSCIVVVNAPSKDVYYGNLVAGPIFQEVANKVYATSIEIHKELQEQNDFIAKSKIPYSKSGHKEDLKNVLDELGVSFNDDSKGSWVVTQTGEKQVQMLTRKVQKGLVPNVLGLGLQDALYLLENCGLEVSFSGIGMVKMQSIQGGTKVIKGTKIQLELS